MEKIRTFLAIPLTEELVQATQALRRELSRDLPEIRWASPETLHITLKFFGDLPEESLENIGEVVLSISTLHSPFQVELAGLGAFPTAGRARVIWLGIGGSSPLKALQTSIDEGLGKIGIPREERPWSPHLTLGRSRSRPIFAREVLERYRTAACGSLQVDRLILFESRLRPGGALHLPRRTFQLGR